MRHRSGLRVILEGIEGLLVSVGAICTWPVSKRWLTNWGARPTEHDRRWPGDAFVSSMHRVYTRAIDIAAPPATVWAWIVQFGLDRAGFYSYELLERLVGIPVVNVESIEPSMQSLAIGDEIRLHPKAPGIPVVLVEPNRHICFGTSAGAPADTSSPDPNRSWSMYVEPVGSTGCRLLLRACVEPPRDRSWSKRMTLAIEEPIDFVMEQRMLRTVKRLAESG